MRSVIKTERTLILDGKTFREGSELSFYYNNHKYISRVYQIVPEMDEHPAALLLVDNEIYDIGASAPKKTVTGVVYVKIDDIGDVKYVYGD